MVQFLDHAASRGSIFYFNYLIDFSQPQSVKRTLLILGGTNPTLDLLYLYSCHKNLLIL